GSISTYLSQTCLPNGRNGWGRPPCNGSRSASKRRPAHRPCRLLTTPCSDYGATGRICRTWKPTSATCAGRDIRTVVQARTNEHADRLGCPDVLKKTDPS